jgi:hypothetical protein
MIKPLFDFTLGKHVFAGRPAEVFNERPRLYRA